MGFLPEQSQMTTLLPDLTPTNVLLKQRCLYHCIMTYPIRELTVANIFFLTCLCLFVVYMYVNVLSASVYLYMSKSLPFLSIMLT